MATGGRVKLTNQEIQDLSEINDDSTPNESPFKKRKMATGGDLTLTDTQIEDLAQIIVSKHMATIAIKYLGLPQETVENLRSIRHNDYAAFNRDLLVLWRNKNPGINQVQVSIFTARKRSLDNIFTGVCQQFCSQGGVCSRRGVPGGDPPGTATAAGGTHPTGMHSCTRL